jgi:hypothetical protein
MIFTYFKFKLPLSCSVEAVDDLLLSQIFDQFVGSGIVCAVVSKDLQNAKTNLILIYYLINIKKRILIYYLIKVEVLFWDTLTFTPLSETEG